VSVPELRAPGQTGPEAAEPPAAGGLGAAIGHLFPAPAEAPARAPAVSRAALIAGEIVAVALGALVMLLRVGPTPAWRSIYSEDYGVYLPQALAHPWELLQSYAGYLQLLPRLIGQIAALLPVRAAAVTFAVSGALVAAGTGLFAFHASEGHIASRWLRALLGLSVVLLPVAQLEIADNGVNTIWYLVYALFWAALWRPRSRAGASVAAALAFLAAASSPLAMIFAPLFAARVVAVPRRFREHAATVGWLVGCALQILVILTSHESRTGQPSVSNGLLYIVRQVVWPALGWHIAWHLRAAVGLSGATVIVAGVGAVLLAVVLFTQPVAGRVFVLTAGGTGLLFALIAATLSWVPTQRVTTMQEPGARYSTIPILLFDAVLIAGVAGLLQRFRPRALAVAAAAALIAVLAVGWVTDFNYPVNRLAGAAWAPTAAAWLRSCEHNPAGTITVPFKNYWGPTPLSSTFSCSALRR
jgi:hypothetical protein